MKYCWHENGGYYFTQCPNFDRITKQDHVQIAITSKSLKLRVQRGLRHQLGQLFGIIGPGAIAASSAHRGLMRSMLVGDNGDAHREKIALVINPKSDAIMMGSKFEPHIGKISAPPNHVFVVYLSPNKMIDQFQAVNYWIEHWTWIDADTETPEMPDGYRARYNEACIWPE